METKTHNNKTRQYYIDWLRIILILTVFLFHIGMIFNTFDWHIKSDQQFKSLAPVMSFLHLWRMPLLFLISGAGTFYALRKRKPLQYLKERFQRLFVPLVAGIFILVPVQVYYERIDQYESLLSFYPDMFQGVYPAGNFSWHHLWFIAYLFTISLMITPLLNFFKSRKFRRWKRGLDKTVIRPGGMNLIIVPLFLSQLLLKPYFPEETHALVNDWAFISYNLIFFLAGFIFMINPLIIHYLKKQRKFYLVETLLSTILLFFIRYGIEANQWIYELARITVAWSCGITAVAYAAVYLNKDSSFRKLANEAIYPFYLLHQPLIIVFGYYIIQWDVAVWIKVLSVTFTSFIASVFIYWYFIRPFSFTRVIFGMKRKTKPSPNCKYVSANKFKLKESRKTA
jgi:peptidoglycan/LPS O-acetylase OafA/YrhL